MDVIYKLAGQSEVTLFYIVPTSDDPRLDESLELSLFTFSLNLNLNKTKHKTLITDKVC